jgi:phospholipase C
MPSLSTLTTSSLLLFLTYGIEAARVKHIIAIMMENHSFDNMLGWLPFVDGENATGKCNTFQGKT